MDTNGNDKELADLLGRLGIDDDQARTIRQDIEAGDELLSSLELPELPKALQQRVMHTLQQRRTRARAWQKWATNAAAVAAIVLITAGLLWQADKRSGQQAGMQQSVSQEITVLDDEEALWELALLQNDYDDQPVDDVMLEVLNLWQENNGQVLEQETPKLYLKGASHEVS